MRFLFAHLRWLLPASLALNVFLGAALVIQNLSRFPHGPPPDPRHFADMMAGHLPPNDGDILRRSFAAHDAEINGKSEGMKGFRHRLDEAIRSEPFDPTRVAAALAQGRQARQDLDQAMSSAIIEALGQMTPEGRRRFADPPRGP
jgi:uncharacterized membrane protein